MVRMMADRGAQWSLVEVLDVVTDAVPEREMLVWLDVRRTFRQIRDRSRRLAQFFLETGIGLQRERDQLQPWESGQAHVAMLMSNCPEYVEAMIGAYRARAVPFNVNQHYHPTEICDLLEQMQATAVVYHRRLGGVLQECPELGKLLMIDVDDGSGAEPLPGSVNFEAALTGADVRDLPDTQPDDLYLVCTGGTTGPPKGVLWRQADAYVATMGGAESTSPDLLVHQTASPATWFATSPLMHAAGHRTVFSGVLQGGTAVLHDDARPFDAKTILETAQREKATVMTIVGDAYAAALIDELNACTYDLTELRRIGTGGAMTSPKLKQALLEKLPQLTILDSYSSSETGRLAVAASNKGEVKTAFAVSKDAGLLSADRSRFLSPGEDEIGWMARRGRVPLGYLNDPQRTAQTFPFVDGERVAVPGDRAVLTQDGEVKLLGRDSNVVNTGGEKVFVEEVEEAIRRHPDVADAVVVGRPHERFGSEVVAIVQVRAGADLSPQAVREIAAQSIARFKAPRAVLLCERIQRHASGKADYGWAREVAKDAAAATSKERSS
jgi:fatty-acyl-CoA synthase